MKKALLIICVVFQTVFGQTNIPSHRMFVDSLLTELNDPQSKALFGRMDERSRSQLLNKIAAIDTADRIACENICESFYRQKVVYDSSKVPRGISAVYDAASRSMEKDSLRDAVKAFYVAFALKLDFVQEEKARLQRNYERTRSFLAADELDSLGRYIEQYRRENTFSPAFIALENETHFSEFYRSAGRVHVERSAVLNYEQTHAEEFHTGFTVEIGGGGTIASRRMSPDLYKTDYLYQVDTLLPAKQLNTNQQSTANIFPHLSVSVNVSGSFHAVVSAAYQKIRLTELGFRSYVMDFEFYNSNFLDVTMMRYSLGVRYLLRNKIGIRPFVEASIGTVHSSSEYKKLLAVYQFTSFAMKVSEWTPFIQIYSGMEYVPSAQSRFIYAVKFGGEKFFGTPRYTGEYSIYLGGTVNYIIL
jgi:hypothetical protein